MKILILCAHKIIKKEHIIFDYDIIDNVEDFNLKDPQLIFARKQIENKTDYIVRDIKKSDFESAIIRKFSDLL